MNASVFIAVLKSFFLVTVRVCARKFFSFATTFANLIFFVPLSKSLSQDFGHILPETFMLKVNFRFFSHCKQPCYLPIGKTCLGSAAALFAFYTADESRKMVKNAFYLHPRKCIYNFFFF